MSIKYGIWSIRIRIFLLGFHFAWIWLLVLCGNSFGSSDFDSEFRTVLVLRYDFVCNAWFWDIDG